MPPPRAPPHEKLVAYREAHALAVRCHGIARSLREREDLADQLQRASASVVLNIAEGAGELRRGEKVRFYRMSRRSIRECEAILALLRDVKLLPEKTAEQALDHCGRVSWLLTRLMDAWDGKPKHV